MRNKLHGFGIVTSAEGVVTKGKYAKDYLTEWLYLQFLLS